MNPDSGEFIQDTAAAKIPEEWPKFSIGDRFVLNGVTFEIHRIKPTTVSIKPVIPGYSAMEALTKLTRGDKAYRMTRDGKRR